MAIGSVITAISEYMIGRDFETNFGLSVAMSLDSAHTETSVARCGVPARWLLPLRWGEQDERLTPQTGSFVMSQCASNLHKIYGMLSGLLLSVAIIQVANGGPDFGEESDAGGLPPTSKTISTSSSRPVGRVSGSTALSALTGDGDRVDMFLLRTGSDLSQFKFIGPSWGARLTLFKKDTVVCTGGATLTVGRPICTVAKAAVGQEFPVINGAAPVTGITGGSSGALSLYLQPNSDYYVAVSGVTNRPLCDNAPCSSTTTDDVDVFGFATGFGQFLAGDNFRTSYRIARWLDPDGEATGAYAMDTTGTFTAPASTCREVETVVGNPAEKSFDFNFAPNVPTGTADVPCAPGFTVTRQFFFLWSPECSGEAEVTTCGLTGADSAIEVFDVDACSFDTCAAALSASVACNDQCGSSNSSRVTFPASTGSTYLVRLTRLVTSGTQSGTIRFSCSALPPSADLNGDGTVNAADLAVLLARWGTAGN